jgi:hypothetical protein
MKIVRKLVTLLNLKQGINDLYRVHTILGKRSAGSDMPVTIDIGTIYGKRYRVDNGGQVLP